MVREAHVLIFAAICILGSTAPALASVPGTHQVGPSVQGMHDGGPFLQETSSQEASIDSFSYEGDGAINDLGDPLHLWQSEAHVFSVTVQSDEGFDGAVCLTASAGDDEQELSCRDLSISENESESVTLSVDQWPANLTGNQDARVDVMDTNSTRTFASETLELTVLQKDGDLDDDGLPNEREVSLGTDIRNNDTDSDGLTDGPEVRTYETSPTSNDTDGDGLSDQAEVETHQTDPTSSDSDGDGLTDPRELELGTDPNSPDSDGDDIADGLEVNTYETDPANPDTDGDGLDDGAEVNQYETNPKKNDTDGDGLGDNLEVSTYETDPNKVDTDGDGLTDGAEVNTHGTNPTNSDTDGDGLGDGEEVNTYGTNPTNDDTDGDGLADGAEVNKHETDPTDPDTDGDGVGDAVEVDEANAPPLPPALMAVIGLVALVLVALLAVLAARRLGYSPLAWRRGETDQPSSTDTTLDESPKTTGDGQDSVTEDSVTAVDATATTDGKGSDETVPPEFLSNEEQVLALIDENGGRMRQTELVEATDWSKSKVSRVLSAMESDGEIVKVDVGRGNVVMRPDDLPPGAESAFEE